MSALTSLDQDYRLAYPVPAESLKRSRSFTADDAEEADLRWRKRAIAATSGRPQEEPELDRTSYSLTEGTDSNQANGLNFDDDDDDVSMSGCSINGDTSTGTSEVEGQLSAQGEVCFGSICDAKAAFLINDPPYTFSTEVDTIQRFPVSSRQDCYCLQSSDGTDFAVVHSRTAAALQTLRDFSSIRLVAVFVGGDFNKPVQQHKKGKKVIFSISIDVFGPEKIIQAVGKLLSKAHTYLQHPINLDSGIPYNNPHYYAIPGVRNETKLYVSSVSATEHQQAPILDIAKFFEEVDHTRSLLSQNADWHIRTPLLEHQKEALYFITQKENASIGDAFSLWKAQDNDSGSHYYQHTILGSRRLANPDSPRGGILADDMGLGKTLSMISAIAMSLNEAQAFMSSHNHVHAGSGFQNLRRASSTLVIAPSPVLLDGWEDEIQRHVNPGLLKIHKYHGIGKEIDLDSIAEFDVVMTTYATIASDVAKRSSILQQIMWFRIVLDEAHAVRHQSTQQFRAVYSLHAERRWCLTGTPIQNRLEDLGSLIRFLRVVPFDSNTAFRTHISEPLLTDPDAGDRNLRLLLRSVCLRRTRVLLNLPNAENQTVNLSLSTEERSVYCQIIEDTKRNIDDCISTRSLIKAYSGIFHAILRLRLLCNNGTQQISDTRSEFHGGCAKDGDVEGGQLACQFCSCEIIDSEAQNDISPRASPQNSHLPCPACLTPNDIGKTKDEKKPGKQRPKSSQRVQQICTTGNSSPRSQSGDRAPSTFLRPSLLPNRHSSKLSALVNNIHEEMLGNKSIVFTCWKTTLNLLELVLESASIQYVRIDGAIPTVERNRIIKQFQDDPNTKLLLMTTGTGAVGLNLTAATRVHLLEPQWNPAIEAQAIGRALRLGQTRTVTIIPYVMKKTIEESIQSRQLMKLQLAELTLEKKEGNEQTMLQRLKDLRSLLHQD